MYVQCSIECEVQWGMIMSTVEGIILKYIGRYHIKTTVGDVQISTMGIS